jgi:hypothetical protein
MLVWSFCGVVHNITPKMAAYLAHLLVVGGFLLLSFANVSAVVTNLHIDMSELDHADYHGFEHHRALFDAVVRENRNNNKKCL